MQRNVCLILSVFIAICLALQVYAYRGRKLIYPFIDYPMYSMASGPPVQTAVRRLFVELPDGREIEADRDYFALAFFAWRYRIIEPLVQPPARVEHPRVCDGTPDEARAMVIDAVRRREGVEPVAAIVRTHWYEVKNSRVVESDDTLRLPLAGEASP